jgi:hypothetical protein
LTPLLGSNPAWAMGAMLSEIAASHVRESYWRD